MKNCLWGVFLIISIISLSCSSNKKNNYQATINASHTDSISEEQEGKLVFDTVKWRKSFDFNKDSRTEVELNVIFFKAEGGKLNHADSTLMIGTNNWVCEHMGDSTHYYCHSLSEFVPKMGAQQFANDKEELRELLKDAQNASYEYSKEISVIYEDDDYITLQDKTYIYTAGAHGSTIIDCVTLSKKDGQRCGWELLSSLDDKELTERIHHGLMEYFEINEGDEATKNQLLREQLFGDGINGMSDYEYYYNFPKPSTEPFLTKKGVAMIYQQYEIACYAAGMPSFIVLEHKSKR